MLAKIKRRNLRSAEVSFSKETEIRPLPPCPPWLVASLLTSMTVDSASDRDTFLLIVRRYRPDIHVDVPVPGDLVFVSSCLVSLILVSGGKENSDYKMCNHTTRIPLNGSPVNAQNSHQCHICELYGKSFVQKMRTRTTVFPASKIKKPPQAHGLKRLNLHYFSLRAAVLSHRR